jgi:hypothetical protein
MVGGRGWDSSSSGQCPKFEQRVVATPKLGSGEIKGRVQLIYIEQLLPGPVTTIGQPDKGTVSSSSVSDSDSLNPVPAPDFS